VRSAAAALTSSRKRAAAARSAGRLDRSAYGFPEERAGELEAAVRGAGLEVRGWRRRECDGEPTLALLVGSRAQE
jgi:hypothetical protein